MADKEGFDIGRDLPVFLASVLDKTEYICQNDEGEGAAEAHVEVIDQSIRMLRSIIDCRDIGTLWQRGAGFTCSSFCARVRAVFK